MVNNKRSYALKISHLLMSLGRCDDFGKAQRIAWASIRLRSDMTKRYCKVRFLTKANEERTYTGSILNRNLYKLIGGSMDLIITFLCKETESFKSLRIENLLSYD